MTAHGTSTGQPEPARGSLFQGRFALLRDLDSADLRPFGVLMQTSSGAALLTYEVPASAVGLRRDWDDFDTALASLSRSFVVTAIGQEGE